MEKEMTHWQEARRQFILQRLVTVFESCLSDAAPIPDLRPDGDETDFSYPYWVPSNGPNGGDDPEQDEGSWSDPEML